MVDCLGISHHAPQSLSQSPYISQSFHIWPLAPWHSPRKENVKILIKNKTKQKPILLLCLSCLSVAFSIMFVALGAVVCHTVYPFAHLALLANVHCNDLLVRFKTSGLWRWVIIWVLIITGFSLKILLNILLLPQFMEILWLCFCRTSSIMHFDRSYVVDIKIGQI